MRAGAARAATSDLPATMLRCARCSPPTSGERRSTAEPQRRTTQPGGRGGTSEQGRSDQGLAEGHLCAEPVKVDGGEARSGHQV